MFIVIAFSSLLVTCLAGGKDDLPYWKRAPEVKSQAVERPWYQSRHNKNSLTKTQRILGTILKKYRNRRLVLAQGALPANVTQIGNNTLNSTTNNNTLESWPKVRARTLVKSFKLESPRHTNFQLVPSPMLLIGRANATVLDAPNPPGEDVKSTTETLAQRREKKELINPYALAKQMAKMMQEFPEVNATVEVLGRTMSYNDIVLLKIQEQKSDVGTYFRADDKYLDEIPEKKILFLVHGLSVMGVRKVDVFRFKKDFEKLLRIYFSHLDKFDIFLIPMANPDGYVMSFNKNMWNKNFSPQSHCFGVAIDRNFDVAFDASTVTNTCSQMYPGPSAFSEIESQVVRDVFHRYGHKIAAYIHVHPGMYDESTLKGEAVLYPKGYSDSTTDDDKYIDLKGEIEEGLNNASFHVMTVAVDSLYNWYGKVHGTSVDYASTIYGIPYAMEFVMQVYSSNINTLTKSSELYSNISLKNVWKMIIDVIFTNIHKTIKNAEK